MVQKLFSILALLVFVSTANGRDAYPKNPDIDIQHYRFELTLSEDSDEIRGVASIDIQFKKEGVSTLRLDLFSKGQEGRGMVVESILHLGQALVYNHVNNELWISLSAPATMDQHIQISIAYRGIPALGLHIKPNKYGDRTFFSDNWPDLTRHWLPTVDHPYDKATCEFIITAPAHYQVVSNGLKVEETNLSGTIRKTHWKQSVPIACWLYVLGVADFAVQYVDSFEGISIQTWVFRQDRDAGFLDFAKPTKEVLEFYSQYVGPFAYEKLANIQSNSVSGGMEAASAILYSEKSVTGDHSIRWRNVVIHEIAHQWFGNAVTESDWDDVWLSEGFATYFTSLFIEHAYGNDEFVQTLKASRNQVYDHDKKFPTYRIVHENLSDMSQVTSSQTYQKGAWTLHMLRNLMGEAMFQRGIQNYYRRYLNSNATTADFQHEMENASAMDLNTFFKQWLYQPGNVFLNGSWRYDSRTKQLSIDLAQVSRQGSSYILPVEIGIYKMGQDLPEIRKITVTPTDTKFSLQLESSPDQVVVDPRTILLAQWTFLKK